MTQTDSGRTIRTSRSVGETAKADTSKTSTRGVVTRDSATTTIRAPRTATTRSTHDSKTTLPASTATLAEKTPRSRELSGRDNDRVAKTSAITSELRDKSVTSISGRTHSDRVRQMTRPGGESSKLVASASTSGRHDSFRSSGHSPSKSSSRVVVDRNHDVHVRGDFDRHHPRPYIPPHHIHDTHYISHHPGWHSCGASFVFHWSSLSCGYIAAVPYYGGYYGLTYYYPSYHRKYVFVSLGGYWPGYRCVRYYWYGMHPYYWYGPDVIPAEPVVYNTYNTYNTYTTAAPAEPAAVTTTTTTAAPANGDYNFDATTEDFSDVQKRLEAEKNAVDKPEFETAADLTFDHAVKLFETGSYADAAKQFREAMELSPDDVVLPFTYAQALFAGGQYEMAAGVVRDAMAKIPAEEPTIYYPRGLYAKEDVLTAQIAALEQTVGVNPFNADYRLLLGYHYLGMGDLDKAVATLNASLSSSVNAEAAGKLIALAEQLKAEQK